MLDLAEWLEATERCSEGILEWTGYREGVVDALQLARHLGYHVVFDRRQEHRGRLKRVGGRISIFLRPDERPERVQWALCHEIGETLAHRIFQDRGVHPSEGPPGLREQVANLLATRLLLPRRDFFLHARHLDDNLLPLKQRYWTASYELIALRLLDADRCGCVTIVDQGRITKRRSLQSGAFSSSFLPIEQVCWKQAHEEAQFQESRTEEFRVRCWPIHEAHWKREIVISSPGQLA